jgi:hypothetical protein
MLNYYILLQRLALEPQLATLLLNFIFHGLRYPNYPQHRQEGSIVPITPRVCYDVAQGAFPLVFAVMPGDIAAAEVICGEKLIWQLETLEDGGQKLVGSVAETPRVWISVDLTERALAVKFVNITAAG